ncbi:hypothetical protein CKK33_14255 [Mucilaginibacter sp. MD40]|uniref:ComEC/Rec2 family competence protein n=1 Tax=Mucilaginibacter sp. MD40 TaxID=2029590 RepID=UPI000BAC7428|nr:ComEC/Rec2 family competence protein [Mucilaginibacter sp. MD40]PAW94589.1 hypothetical protein CKK33_14255 [Mucilaginibacter sp. MD40]
MINRHRGEIPVVLLLLPFIAGIACGIWNAYEQPYTWVGILLALLATVFIALNIAYQTLRLYHYRWIGTLLIIPILFLTGLLFTLSRNELNHADHFSRQQAKYLLVNINSEPSVKSEVTRFTADIVSAYDGKAYHHTTGTMLIAVKDKLATNLFYGEQLLIPANYSAPDPPFNLGEFNYKQYLANKHIHQQAYLYPGQYRVLGSGKGNQLISYALQTRQQLVDKLRHNMKDTTAMAVASTLILGYKADLSADVMQTYAKTGTIHILSVSGGHVAILLGLLVYILGFLPNKQTRVFKAVIILMVIWAYAVLTGLSPAVCRAAVMITLIIAGKTYSRQLNSLNLLAVSAFVLLLYDPYLLTDVGFQLSYLAVAGILILQPVIYGLLSIRNKWLDKLWLACSVSVAAQAFTFPLSLYYFHQFPAYFIVSNLLIVLPVGLIMYAGLLLLVLPQWPWVSQALGWLLEKSILMMNRMLAFVEQLPFASINKVWITPMELVLLSCIVLMVAYFLYSKNKRAFIATAIGCLLLFTSFSVRKINADNKNMVIFLNARKQQAIVFKHGEKGVVITNMQPADKAFSYSVQPCLDSMQIEDYRLLPFTADVHNPYLLKKDALVAFGTKNSCC